ncbi:hypothetical protein [Comamonas fluminis]|uniref:hypothetical protein n=1 Tax=Comamonas fluminis TaxID=2796366 RepID=UPI001C4467FA|nr:hypothetical protein [Comamonas fluminis]
MAIDTRDYYKDKHNQAAGYMEGSPLRQSMGEVKAGRRARIRARRDQENRNGLLSFLLKMAIFIGAVVFLVKFLKA